MSNKVGRPPKEIDWKLFEKLCAIQCNAEEIAAVMDMSADTLAIHIKQEYGCNFRELYKRYSCGGKVALRRFLFNNAVNKGHAATAIFLAKQKDYLGYSDNYNVQTQVVDESKELEDIKNQIMKIAKDEKK